MKDWSYYFDAETITLREAVGEYDFLDKIGYPLNFQEVKVSPPSMWRNPTPITFYYHPEGWCLSRSWIDDFLVGRVIKSMREFNPTG